MHTIVQSISKKEKFLSSVIDSLSNNQDLQTSYALVNALVERAQVRLLDPATIPNAIEDCHRAIQINSNNGKSWRTLAEALEISGDSLGALEAVTQWALVDDLLKAKACKEMERLRAKL